MAGSRPVSYFAPVCVHACVSVAVLPAHTHTRAHCNSAPCDLLGWSPVAPGCVSVVLSPSGRGSWGRGELQPAGIWEPREMLWTFSSLLTGQRPQEGTQEPPKANCPHGCTLSPFPSPPRWFPKAALGPPVCLAPREGLPFVP